MNSNTKEYFKHALIAALVGAGIAFLGELLKALTGFIANGVPELIGGAASSTTYLLRAIKTIG